MRYVSLFSGIEAATLAWSELGWEPMAFAENDEFPAAVLASRWPDVPNLGDVCDVDWRKFVEENGRPDVVVGGSPCTSFSLAGGRESLGGESRLMFEYVRACEEIRSPWIVWENVPGVLSTRDDAFGQLLSMLQGIGYVSLAWRVLDAQFFGVAQRRRRVFLVGHLGAGGGAAAVLFERESVRGNTQTGKQKREELAADAGGRADGAARDGEGVTTYTDDNTVTADLHSPAVAFAQNTREEIRLIGGNGDLVGTIAGQPDCKGQGSSLICVSSDATNAEICYADDAPTLLARMHKGVPYVVRTADA